MVARLQLLDGAGQAFARDANVADFDSVTAGETSNPVRMRVKNIGDEAVCFARVRAVPHPSAQTGLGRDTCAATEFALGERGDYAREAELGTLAPSEEREFWMRWKVPAGALAGDVVWALEALGSVA